MPRRDKQAERPAGYQALYRVAGFQADPLKEGGPFRGLVGVSLGYETYRGQDRVRMRFPDGREHLFTPWELFRVPEDAEPDQLELFFQAT